MRFMRKLEALHEQYFGHRHVTVIEPRKGFHLLDFAELWAYRELLWVLAARDVRVRYKQTALGAAWAIIQPVMMMVVFSIFLGHLTKVPSDGLPYPIFVYAGLLPWTFFANAVTQSANSLVGSAALVSKVYFPRLIIPLSSVGASLVDFFIASGVLFLMMLYYGVGFSANLLLAPLLVFGLVLAALSAGTFLSALNVTYRDFRYVIPFLVQFWMFATPVVYPASVVPESWRWLLQLNPMTGLIEGFRAALLGTPLDFAGLTLSMLIVCGVFVLGVAYFDQTERRFADII